MFSLNKKKFAAVFFLIEDRDREVGEGGIGSLVSFMFLPNNIARIDLKWLAESAALKIEKRIQLKISLTVQNSLFES